MNFDEFLDSPFRNLWIEEPGIMIYVRKPWTDGDPIQLANMSADVPGQGSLTAFLDQKEPYHSFYVENVLNERLKDYLLRRGYDIVNQEYPWCMKKEKM